MAGTASPPTASGSAPVPPVADGANLPRPIRPFYRVFQWVMANPPRRAIYVKAMRLVMIIGMVALVTSVILPELTNTAQPAPDPLTFNATFVIAPNNSTAVSGLVDGDDVVAGNFTVTSPSGHAVMFDVLAPGSGSWPQRMPQSLYTLQNPSTAAPVTFTAPYTDWYTFVWTNNSNTTVDIYVSFNYFSSAPPG